MKNSIKWRFIDTSYSDGAYNMAVDQALFSTFIPGESLPVFRLYGWKPPAVSIGRFQRADSLLDLDECYSRGIQVVRRITGGGAIYHSDELTYSFVCPAELTGRTGVKESYRKLCSFLINAYRTFGIEAEYAADSDAVINPCSPKNPLCFAANEEYDITSNRLKIGGNAQKRTRNIIFQHGSIPLEFDLPVISSLFKISDKEITDNSTAFCSLHPGTKSEDLKKALTASFCNNLDIEFIESALTGIELEYAEMIRPALIVEDI
ncbi:MAG: lipoate--protein ligase family protein [Elusimicrobiota bacterium]